MPDVIATLGSSLRGSTEAETAVRRNRYGPDELPDPSRGQVWRRLVAQFTDLFAVVLLASRFGFWRDLPGGPGTHMPEQTLTAAGWPSLPAHARAEPLIDRCTRASGYPDHRAVLDLWRTANVISPAARRDLIRQVLLPMLEVNQGAAAYVGLLKLRERLSRSNDDVTPGRGSDCGVLPPSARKAWGVDTFRVRGLSGGERGAGTAPSPEE
ncbi:cation-transporting P-type ATPase [Streptomyces sp. NPDC093260]|uniref:cation-transporting P-type ATPase n=1 Tax=Streptomyces sp. NPDC093260 TaxID=3155073 RepID=UPI00342C596A